MRVFLPPIFMGVLALATMAFAPAAHAQSTTPPPATCTGYYVCIVTSDPTGCDASSANGYQAMAIGPFAFAGNTDAFAAGNSARAQGIGSFASGTNANAQSNYAVAIGDSALAGNGQNLG